MSGKPFEERLLNTGLLATGVRSRVRFDEGWRFFRGDVSGGELPDFDDRGWKAVGVPHDWSIEGPFDPKARAGGSGGWLPGGIGWYRKDFDFSRDDDGRVVWIEFDGIYHNSDVWINGKHLGRRDYGYVSFHYDLTGHLRADGKNVVAVRVDNSDQPNCRWYSGSGIYRHVWLTTTSDVHVAHWGTSVATPTITPESAEVEVRTRISSRSGTERFTIQTRILDADGNTAASLVNSDSASLGRDADVLQTFNLQRPKLWSVESPALYFARSVVRVNDRIVDEYVTPFGIRSVRFDKGNGFLLNGKPMKMKGICLHHDGGAVGAAVPDRVLQRRLEILKDLGCNAIRCSHNPPAPELLDFCDRMGFLVIDEAFDKWEGAFSWPNEWWMRQNGFAKNWQEDLGSMLHRDRNHPSIVLWSVGNETGLPGTDQVDPTLRMLVEFVRREEPTRNVTAALVHSNAPTAEERAQRVLESGKLMDVLSLNYQEPIYSLVRQANPNIPLLGSEVFRYWRGGAINIHSFEAVNPWYDVVGREGAMGQFLWTGFDYLGEATAFPVHGYPSGIIDTCGFVKADAWFHRSVWKDEPVVGIAVFDQMEGPGEEKWSWGAPQMVMHWNLPQYKERLVRLQTQTNCQTVELFLNGVSYGERALGDYPNRAILWHVPWAAGKVEAIGRNEGQVVARDQLQTSGACVQISIHADRVRLAADGLDVSHVEVRLIDDRGVTVPDGDRLIQFELAGPGQIIGVDNGNLSSTESYKGTSRTTRGGRCLVIVQSTCEAGDVRLTASSQGLPAGSVTIETVD